MLVFSAFNHTELLKNGEQSIKSKMAQAVKSKNEAVVMLDHPGNRSNAFDMKIAEPMFESCHGLPIPIAIDTSQWNCCLSNKNALHLLSDEEYENFFRMNMVKDLSLFHQKLVKKRHKYLSFHHFGYSIFSSMKSTFNELRVVVRGCQLPILLVLQHIHSETQKHVIGEFPCAECDETLQRHIQSA